MIEKSSPKGNNKQNSLKGIVDETSKFAVDFSNLTNNPAKKTEHKSFDSNLRSIISPDIEYIGQSLKKVQNIKIFSEMLWSDKKISGKITSDVIKIMNKVYRKNFLFGNGKSLRCPLGGLFYLLGHRYGDPKKQREVALVLQTTEVSIRIYYKQWLRDFPELFQDITGKLSKQDLFRKDYCKIP